MGVLDSLDFSFPLHNQITLALYQTIKCFNAFVDVKLNVAKMRISLFERVESIVRKGENPGYKHFQLFPRSVFLTFFLSVVKSLELVVKS